MYPDVEKFYKICVDSYINGVCITDKNGVITMNNRSFEQIFGYPEKALLHQNIRKLIPDKYRETHINHFMQLLNDNQVNEWGVYDLYGLRKDRNIVHLEVLVKKLNVDGQPFYKFEITDISLRKKKERKMKQINYGLEQEIRKQNYTLQNLVTQLQSSNTRLKKEVKQKIKAEQIARDSYKKEKEYHFLQTKFLSMASHEFKTPLSGILTSASLIERYNDGNNEKISTHVQKIKKLVNQFNNILDDFLLLERAESRRFEYKPETFSFCELLKEVIQNAHSLLKSGQHIRHIKCDDPVTVYHDRKILALIFRNIIHNAIKYSPEGKKITVKVKMNGLLKVKVKDEGIGIPKNDRKHIFERFFRAQNATHIQGTGIGLNIVKQHIDALGGKIRFKSKTGRGTTFTVHLPLNFETTNGDTDKNSEHHE